MHCSKSYGGIILRSHGTPCTLTATLSIYQMPDGAKCQIAQYNIHFQFAFLQAYGHRPAYFCTKTHCKTKGQPSQKGGINAPFLTCTYEVIQ
jgi:hypothetical protein